MSSLTQRVMAWFSGLMKPAADGLPIRLGATRSLGARVASSRVTGFDQPLVWVTVALLAWGLVMVYSASIAMPDNPRFAKYTHTYFLTRHVMWLIVAFVAALLE